MTDTIKVLAQSAPSATSLTDIYTVAASTSATISSITICNQNAATEITFRISIAVAGLADTPKQYLYYDLPLGHNDTFIATIGVTLATTDVVRVYTSATSVVFSVFGIEVT